MKVVVDNYVFQTVARFGVKDMIDACGRTRRTCELRNITINMYNPNMTKEKQKRKI